MLWWRKIWLLSTSAFLSTRSYLPSPLEERSIHFSFLLLCPFPLSPSHSCPSRFSRLIYLVATSPFILHFLILQFFSRSLWCVFFPPSTPPFASLSPPSSFTLSGTAHSATKQSCLEHRTLANQAGQEFSSLQTHSATSRYKAEVEGRGGGASPEERMGRIKIQSAIMSVKDGAGGDHQVFSFQWLCLGLYLGCLKMDALAQEGERARRCI